MSQESLFFENQIILPSNLQFTNDSISKNVQDIITTLTGGNPGIVAGLLINGIGLSTATITTGYGFLGNGEYVQLFSPSGLSGFPFSGSTSVFANLSEVNYNPDPAYNPQGPANTISGLNAASLTFQPVQQYNLLNLTTSSGTGYIKLGDVITNFGLIQSINYTNRQNFTIGQIDLFNNIIPGNVISSGSIDSFQFTNPLHSDIYLNSGVNIWYEGSGINTLASSTNPLGNIFAVSGTFHVLNGFSPISTTSLIQQSGASIEASTSFVNIDTENNGTQFGKGVVVTANTIDLRNNQAYQANLNIITQSGASISLSTNNINLNANTLVNNSNLQISGGSVSIVNGNLNAPIINTSIISGSTINVNNSIVMTSGASINFVSGSSLILTSGASISTSISGAGFIGTSSAPLHNIYANDFWSTIPTFAFLKASGTSNPTQPISTSWTVISGSIFHALSGANFSIAATNPHSITYMGSQPIYVSVNISATIQSSSTENTLFSLGMILNGNNTISGVTVSNIIELANAGNPSITWGSTSINNIISLVSGNTIQAALLNNNSQGATVPNMQISVTKLI